MTSKTIPFTSAVYRTNVKTFTLARQLFSDTCLLLRVVRAHRTPASRQLRQDVAAAARALRRAGKPFPPVPKMGLATRLN